MAIDPAKPCLRFGPYLLDLPRRRLLRDRDPVPLGGRALDLLAALVEAPGQILDREALVRRVWPRTVVEESSLRVHIAALRRALGESGPGATDDAVRYIANVPGRGYGFLGTVTAVARDEDQAVAPLPDRGLPATSPGEALIGRDDELAAMADALRDSRLLTVLGPGGIGKTRVALALAAREAARFPDGRRVVDLSPVGAPEDVPGAVAAALGLSAAGADPACTLAAALAERRLLLVLDNCEHVVGAAATLAASLLAQTQHLTLLATSRESLGLTDERVWPLPALAMEHEVGAVPPAVALFIARAGDALAGVAPDDARLLALCRRLDGLPLALELAAARLPALGLDGLAQRLDLLLGPQAGARRDGDARHRTLQALIAWSDGLLEEPERVVLRRLAVFRHEVERDDATALVADAGLPAARVEAALDSLLRKSLLTTVAGAADESPRLRLLFVTRGYAERRLRESPDYGPLAVRHARHVERLLHAATRELHGLARVGLGDWHRRHAGLLEELRAAVARTLAGDGDARAALSLIAAARPVMLEFGLFAEGLPWVERALTLVDTLDPPDPSLELQLRISACFLGVVTGRGGARQDDMVERTLALARADTDPDARIEALYGLASAFWGLGEHRRLAPLIAELRGLIPDLQDGPDGPQDPASILMVGRLKATLDFFDGRFDAAAARLHQVGRVPDTDDAPLHRRWAGHSPRAVIVGQYLARLHWIQGRGEEADAVIEGALAALDPLMPLSLGVALGMAAIPVAIWQGRDALALARLERLAAHVARHRQGFWPPVIEVLRWVLDERSRVTHGLPPGQPPPPWPTRLVRDLVATFDLPWDDPDALARARAGELGWCAAELLRADAARRGERLTAGDAVGRAAIEQDLAVADTLAAEQGALAWRLRIATTRARLRLRWDGRDAVGTRDARAALAQALRALPQGRDASDPVRARALLDELSTGDDR